MTNHDPKPWVTNDGYEFRYDHDIGGRIGCRYQPRPEYESDDPRPWAFVASGVFDVRAALPGENGDGWEWIWAPRLSVHR